MNVSLTDHFLIKKIGQLGDFWGIYTLGLYRLSLHGCAPSQYFKKAISKSKRCFVAWKSEYNQMVSITELDSVSVAVFGPPWLSPNSKKDAASYIAEGLYSNIPLANLLAQMDGGFIVVIWNEEAHTGILATDPIGRFPVYYSISDRQVVWASHPAPVAIIANNGIELSREALNIYFALKGLPAPWSLLKGVKKLPPGHLLYIQGTSVEIQEYLSITEKTYEGSFLEAQEDLIQKIKHSIEQCVKHFRPMGVFLSGGLDSTVLTAVTRELTDVYAFSVGYSPNYYTDETKQAILVANSLGIPIETRCFSPSNAINLLDKIAAYMPEPVADMALLPLAFLASYASSLVKCVLDGTGADAILGGSYKFVAEHYRRIFLRMPLLLRKGLIHLLCFLPTSRRYSVTNRLRQLGIFIRGAEIPSSQERIFFWSVFFPYTLLKKVLSTEWVLERDIATEILHNLLLQYGDQEKGISRISYMSLRGITAGVELPKLAAVERVSGVFVHTPFLSTTVVRFALSLPDSYKVNGPYGKVVLREAFKHLVPQQTLQRRKANFSPPIGQWLTGHLQELFWETLAEIQKEGILNPQAIRHLWQEQQIGWKDWSAELWAIVIFQRWWKHIKTQAGTYDSGMGEL